MPLSCYRMHRAAVPVKLLDLSFQWNQFASFASSSRLKMPFGRGQRAPLALVPPPQASARCTLISNCSKSSTCTFNVTAAQTRFSDGRSRVGGSRMGTGQKGLGGSYSPGIGSSARVSCIAVLESHLQPSSVATSVAYLSSCLVHSCVQLLAPSLVSASLGMHIQNMVH